MLEKHYPSESQRRALCLTDKAAIIILIALHKGENPEKIFNLDNEIKKEIYEMSVIHLEECGYLKESGGGNPEITDAGKNFIGDLLK